MPKRQTIIPALSYEDPNAAVAFLEAAFGFETHLLVTDADDPAVPAGLYQAALPLP